MKARRQEKLRPGDHQQRSKNARKKSGQSFTIDSNLVENEDGMSKTRLRKLMEFSET